MMQQRSCHSFEILITILLLISPVAQVSAQQWFAHYRDGKEALRQGKYTDAVALISQAIAQRPDSKADARTYGVKFIDYFPYLYRGIAYAKLGNRTSALKDFEQEHAAGEVYRGNRDVGAGKLLRARLDEYRATTVSRESTSAPTVDGVPDSLFNASGRELAQGNPMQAKALLLEVKKRRSSYPGLDEQLSRIRGFELEVRKGIGAFLNGKYRQAVESLTPLVERGRDCVNAHAFLGCSHAALYLLSGNENDNDRDKAIQAFSRVKQLDPSFDLKRAYVSPAIQDVFAAAPAGEQARRNSP